MITSGDKIGMITSDDNIGMKFSGIIKMEAVIISVITWDDNI
jgi:hypothetical protein